MQFREAVTNVSSPNPRNFCTEFATIGRISSNSLRDSDIWKKRSTLKSIEVTVPLKWLGAQTSVRLRNRSRIRLYGVKNLASASNCEKALALVWLSVKPGFLSHGVEAWSQLQDAREQASWSFGSYPWSFVFQKAVMMYHLKDILDMSGKTSTDVQQSLQRASTLSDISFDRIQY